MRRFPDWVPRLTAAIEARAETPFKWGSFDCCLAACDLWKAQTGVDPMADLRGYKTKAGALRTLAKEAPEAPQDRRLEALAVRLGRETGLVSYPATYAQRGFLVFIEGREDLTAEGMDTIGTVNLRGDGILIPHTDGGWVTLPLTHATMSWGV